MVNASLIEYIKKYHEEYDVETLRTYLINQGYNPSEINRAIKIVLTTKRERFVKPAIIITIVIFLSLLSYYFFFTETTTINLELFAEKTKISFGESFIFSASLGSNKEEQGAFSYILFNAENKKILENFETIKGERFVKKTFTINTKNIPPDKYYLEFVFSLEEKEATDSLFFEVLPSKEEKQKKETTCPHSCDDNDPNTIDSCINEKCVNELKNLCGNKTCDTDESKDSCPIDCKNTEENTDNFKKKAEQLADSNTQEAINECLQLSIGYDDCLNDLNEKTNNAEFCNAIISLEFRDSCFSSHALRSNDFSVCSQIKNTLKQRACFNLKKSNPT